MKTEWQRQMTACRYAILASLNIHGQLRRFEISDMQNIRRAYITIMVKELLKEGIVRSQEPSRLRSPICLDTEKFHCIAVCLYGDRITLVRVFLDGHLEDAQTLPLQNANPKNALQTMLGAIKKTLSAKRNGVLGIGVAVPGRVDVNAGIVMQCDMMKGWDNVKLKEIIEKEFDIFTLVDSSVRSQLWGASWFGKLWRGTQDIIYLEITDTLRASLLVRGQRVHGKSFYAGEVGHVKGAYCQENRVCRCGKVDCVETYCAIPAIISEIGHVAPGSAKLKNAADIAAFAKDNLAVRNVLARQIRPLANVLSGIIMAFNPEMLLIGTEDNEFSSLITEALKINLQLELSPRDCDALSIKAVESIETGTSKGISALVIDNCFFNGRFHGER